MVKFTPRPITDNVNVSKVSQKKEFLTLTFGLIGILALFYFLLGAAFDVMIDRFPAKFDSIVDGAFEWEGPQQDDPYFNTTVAAQRLLDELVTYLPDASKKYRVSIIKREDVNAVAVPGNRIMIFSGLLEEIDSENELAMILGHELGHFANRDHLRAMSRGFMFVCMMSLFMGADSGLADLAGNTLTTVNMKFSRKQESAADLFALDLLQKKYGHVGGATDFFGRLEGKKELPRFLNFFLTHPLGERRVQAIQAAAAQLNFASGATVPLAPVFQMSHEAVPPTE